MFGPMKYIFGGIFRSMFLLCAQLASNITHVDSTDYTKSDSFSLPACSQGKSQIYNLWPEKEISKKIVVGPALSFHHLVVGRIQSVQNTEHTL